MPKVDDNYNDDDDDAFGCEVGHFNQILGIHKPKINIDLRKEVGYCPDQVEEVFHKYRDKFVEQIFPQFFGDNLLKNDVITIQSLQRWRPKFEFTNDLNDPKYRDKCYRTANEQLFDLLLKTILADTKLMKNFIESLRMDHWHDNLADMFANELLLWKFDQTDDTPVNSPPQGPFDRRKSYESEMYSSKESFNRSTTTRFFNIPDDYPIYVQRESKEQELLFLLKGFDKKNGWLILHGLGGSGKTTLAASTIKKLQDELFPDGIFWIKIDNISGQQLKIKLDLLAEFVSTYYDPHDRARFRHEQMDNIRFQISRHFEQYKRSLLILDDVWSEEVLSVFNFNISVMVTTQDEGIIHPNRFPNIKKVSIKTSSAKDKDVWTIDEAIKLFNKCFDTNQLQVINSRFPIAQNEHVHEILKNFNYIPYSIPLIFQYIEPLYQELQDSLKFNPRNNSQESIERELNEHWSILRRSITKCDAFHDKWIQLSQRSIANLPEKLKERFMDFAIFCESVPNDVFETFWCDDHCSKLDVKNILSQLRQKSLIIQTYNYSSDRSKKLSYTVHDLTHDFFLHITKESSDIQNRHEILVKKYLDKYCKEDDGSYNFSLLPRDGYIYHNLGYHIHEAKMGELFDSIFLDLGFVIEKIKKTGPSDLLNDYQLYKSNFRNTKKLQDFRLFVASNSSNFLQDNCDLLQLALFQPEESYVYIEARAIIDKQRLSNKTDKKLYFSWLNQATCGVEQMKKLISFQSKKSIDCAAISPDSKIVATIKEQNIELWNAYSGEFLGTNSKHLADIRFCRFSADNRYLLTGDCDGKARLWINKFSSSLDLNSSPISSDEKQDIRLIHQERRRRSSGGNSIQSGDFVPNKSKNLSQYLYLDKIFEESKLKKDARAVHQEMHSTNEFRCGDISSDNQWILIGDGAGFLNLWNVSQTKKIGKIFVANVDSYSSATDDDNPFEIECCSFSKDANFALAMHSTDVFIYQVFPREENVFELFRVLKHEKKCYNAMFFNEFEDLFVISSSHNTHLFEWDLNVFNETPNYSMKPCRSYSITVSECHDNCHVFSYVTISPDGSRIAAFEPTRNEIYFWDRSLLSSALTPSVSASTSMHCDSFSSLGDSVPNKCEEIKTTPCHSYFRSCSDVFILDFCSERDNSLFSASQSGEIVLWDLQKHNRRTSIIDLRKFAYSGRNDNLRLLSIDNAGYLRLYNTLSAMEDRDFLVSLKKHLKALKQSSDDYHKILPKMKITSCDIDNVHIVFGNDNGDVFYFNTGSNLFLHEKLNLPWNDSIMDCVFLRTDSQFTSFIAFSENYLCLFSLCLTTQQITRFGLSLSEMNSSVITSSDSLIPNDVFDIFFNHPRKNWIVMTTTRGRIFILDYSSNQLKIVKVFGVKEEKISCFNFGIWKPDKEIIIVATCNKQIFLRLIQPDPNYVECEDLFYTRERVIKAHCIPRSLAYCNQRSILYVGHDNGDIASIKWTLGRNADWSVFKSNQKSWILDLVLCPEEDILVSGSDSICVWKASTGELLQSLQTQGKIYKLHVCCERTSNRLDTLPRMTISTVSDASCLYIFQTI